MFSSESSCHFAERRLLPRQQGFQTRHRIHVQVEAVSDVKRLGCSASNRISKIWAAVARDDLHTWVLAEPGGHRFYLTVG